MNELTILFELAARSSGLTVETLRGRSRARAVVRARQALAFALAHSQPRLAVTQIAALLKRDPSAVRYAIRVAQLRMDADPRYAGLLGLLVAQASTLLSAQPPPPVCRGRPPGLRPGSISDPAPSDPPPQEAP